MKKVYLFLAAICCCLFLFQTETEAQNSWGNFEVLGGIGISNITKKSQREFLNFTGSNTVNQFEKRSAQFSPGLYAGVEMRILATPERFYFGPYLSYSQYSSVFTYTIEREESLGWNYQRNKITNREYRFGLGVMTQYMAFQRNQHRIKPFFSFGLEFKHAYKSIQEQEIRFFLNEETSSATSIETGKYDLLNYHWKSGIGVNYTYQMENLIPFVELGFRCVQEARTDDWPKENWTIFYLNIGMKWFLSSSKNSKDTSEL